jgi:hypothetical protein
VLQTLPRGAALLGGGSLRNGLVSYWGFDDASGSSVADVVGGNTGTWQGTLGSQWGTGKINGGGVGNGTDGYVLFANPAIGAAATVALWVKPASNWGSLGTGLFDTKPSSVGALRVYGTGAAQLGYELGGAASALRASIPDWTGQWHHVALSLSGGTVTTLFLDGVQVGSGTNSVSGSSNTFRIGRYNPLSIAASVDEAGLWSRALSATEVAALYNGGAGRAYPF